MEPVWKAGGGVRVGVELKLLGKPWTHDKGVRMRTAQTVSRKILSIFCPTEIGQSARSAVEKNTGRCEVVEFTEV